MLSLPTLAPITVRRPPYYHKNHIRHQIHYVEPPKENNGINCRTTIFTKIELPLNKKKTIAEFFKRTLRDVPLRLESKSFLEKMTFVEHTVTFFLPIRKAENEYLCSNALVHLIKELYGNQIELYNSLPHHTWLNSSLMITIDVASFLRKVTSDSLTTTMVMSKSTNKFILERMSYAEDALEIMSLPEDEPDVSWVNYFVKEVPSGNAGQLFSLEQKRNRAFNDIMPSWIDQLYIEPDI
ncbi:OLC1v1019951C1 [Oldenlandia corymbosa var. corymbosa]|uniref:OLC1v1019951C1 n=1 Tax=Oldenlandia corymbosa var. corymbosa TaxID=529605 RepID=A0AAV1EF56_OLDCO|nr:OLC1v1019951C1 [Oldenlandia corymbosa var. corymbosa]